MGLLAHKTNCRSKDNDLREGSASDRAADIASDKQLDQSDGQLHKLHRLSWPVSCTLIEFESEVSAAWTLVISCTAAKKPL